MVMKEKVELLRKVLSDELLYFVVTAMRGPDLINGEYLKTIFTMPLRCIADHQHDAIEAIKSYMNPTYVKCALKYLHRVP